MYFMGLDRACQPALSCVGRGLPQTSSHIALTYSETTHAVCGAFRTKLSAMSTAAGGRCVRECVLKGVCWEGCARRFW